MMRRLFWFCAGVVAGVYGTLQVRRAADGISDRLSLDSVLRAAVSALKAIARTVVDLLGAGTGSRADSDHTVV